MSWTGDIIGHGIEWLLLPPSGAVSDGRLAIFRSLGVRMEWPGLYFLTHVAECGTSDWAVRRRDTVKNIIYIAGAVPI